MHLCFRLTLLYRMRGHSSHTCLRKYFMHTWAHTCRGMLGCVQARALQCIHMGLHMHTGIKWNLGSRQASRKPRHWG